MMSTVREFTQLEPRPYLDRRRLIAPDPSNPLLTPPTKTFRMSGICGPRHITTAGITRILLRSSSMSFRYWITMDSSQKNLFGPPSSLSIRRPNENLGTYWHLRNRSLYSDVMCSSCSTIIFEKEANTRNSTLDTNGTQVQDKAGCSVGV